MRENINNLYDWNERLVAGAGRLREGTVLTHGDLEPKNTMWQGDHMDQAVIIDWEAAGFVHPAYDLFETAMYWAKDNNNQLIKDKFGAFVGAYRRINNIQIDCEAVLDKGYAKLGWLAYSLKRSLGIEGADESEKQMGTEHVIWALNDLLSYTNMRKTLKAWLGDS